MGFHFPLLGWFDLEFSGFRVYGLRSRVGGAQAP